VAQGVQIGRGYIAVEVDEGGARAALRGFVSFAGSAFKTAVVAAGALVGAAAKVGIQFNSMQEQASVAFKTLLGSGEKAQAFLLDLQQFAAKTPFELPGLINNARQLLGVGVAANKVIPTLNSLGNAAGALGIDQERFNNILLAVTQSMGKGKLQGEELMQMVENGIPVWQLLSKATGKSVTELQDMSSAGKLLAAETLPKLFDQMNKDYGGAMAAQSQTLSGQWSSLKDNAQILTAIGFKPLFNETKNVTGALGELAASDKANQFANDFADGLDRGIKAAKIFGLNAKTELSGTTSQAIDTVRSKFFELWPMVKEGAGSAGTVLLAFAKTAAPALLELAQTGSGLLRPALEAVNKVLAALADRADDIADGVTTAAHVVGAVAVPVFKLLALGVAAAGDVLALIVDLVADLSGVLGGATGIVLGAVFAWRTLSGTLGGIPSLWKRINPADVADGLSTFTKRADDVALSAGVMAEQLTGSATAGERVATAGSRVGNVMAKVGAAIPIVGLAATAVGVAFEVAAEQARQLEQGTQDMASALLRGGTAAEQVRTKLDYLRQVADAARDSTDQFAAATGDLADQIVNKTGAAYDQQIAGMSAVQQAQTFLTQAQNDYDLAVTEFGSTSVQARNAHEALAAAARGVEAAERNAADATRSHEQSLWDLADAALAQANADVALRQANLNATEAQQAYTAAVKEHGAKSQEAQQASLNLEQSYIRAADAAAKKATSDNAGATAAQQAAAATAAYNGKLMEMLYAAGTAAPPALLRMLTGLDNTTLAAMNAAAETSGFRTKVLQLPDGRTVKIAVDDQGRPKLDAFKRAYDSLVNKTVVVKFVTTGNKAGALSSAGGINFANADGGAVYNGQYGLVGEEGPELITRTRGGWVHDAEQTAKMLGMVSSSQGGGNTITQNIMAPASVDTGQVADLVVDKLNWRGR
jgi:tape measure domain-containing protein